MKHGKILVVDDNQSIRNALKILLPAHFAQVEIIASPKSLVTVRMVHQLLKGKSTVVKNRDKI